MGSQSFKGFFRSIGGRRQAVGTQADPCQNWDQGNFVKERRLINVPRSANKTESDALKKRLLGLVIIYIHAMGLSMRTPSAMDPQRKPCLAFNCVPFSSYMPIAKCSATIRKWTDFAIIYFNLNRFTHTRQSFFIAAFNIKLIFPRVQINRIGFQGQYCTSGLTIE